jgi:hypothetical protein
MQSWFFLIVSAFVASLAAAIVGTGGGVLLLPVLALVFGVRDAVPIYAFAQLIGNCSRVIFNWSHIQWRVVFWFCLGALPAAGLGALCFTLMPAAGLTRANARNKATRLKKES